MKKTEKTYKRSKTRPEYNIVTSSKQPKSVGYSDSRKKSVVNWIPANGIQGTIVELEKAIAFQYELLRVYHEGK